MQLSLLADLLAKPVPSKRTPEQLKKDQHDLERTIALIEKDRLIAIQVNAQAQIQANLAVKRAELESKYDYSKPFPCLPPDFVGKLFPAGHPDGKTLEELYKESPPSTELYKMAYIGAWICSNALADKALAIIDMEHRNFLPEELVNTATASASDLRLPDSPASIISAKESCFIESHALTHSGLDSGQTETFASVNLPCTTRRPSNSTSSALRSQIDGHLLSPTTAFDTSLLASPASFSSAPRDWPVYKAFAYSRESNRPSSRVDADTTAFFDEEELPSIMDAGNGRNRWPYFTPSEIIEQACKRHLLGDISLEEIGQVQEKHGYYSASPIMPGDIPASSRERVLKSASFATNQGKYMEHTADFPFADIIVLNCLLAVPAGASVWLHMASRMKHNAYVLINLNNGRPVVLRPWHIRDYFSAYKSKSYSSC